MCLSNVDLLQRPLAERGRSNSPQRFSSDSNRPPLVQTCLLGIPAIKRSTFFGDTPTTIILLVPNYLNSGAALRVRSSSASALKKIYFSSAFIFQGRRLRFLLSFLSQCRFSLHFPVPYTSYYFKSGGSIPHQ
ncbi:hypothetical protein NPIL_554881 [Nephila pilipes]|uniref:Uncharacterized protein n=1 Tax=Nephila pilipes TaxID=299642 RepID=A0A8X6MZ27_NEPPI|nr:hypothetical protein NPIL_554881 [Nephila pilipes]